MICLYGIGHMKDNDLVNAFRENKVEFDRPKVKQGIETFNILVVHQNRYKGVDPGNSFFQDL